MTYTNASLDTDMLIGSTCQTKLWPVFKLQKAVS